jgi:hypothetical protein
MAQTPDVSQNTGNLICPAILTTWFNLLGPEAPSMRTTQVGLLESLFSQQNRVMPGRDDPQDITRMGHTYVYRVNYRQRAVRSETSNDITCATTTTPPPILGIQQTIDQRRSHTFFLSEQEVRSMCEEYSNVVQAQGAQVGDYEFLVSGANQTSLSVMLDHYNIINEQVNALREAIEEDLLNLIAGGLIGSFPVGSGLVPGQPLPAVQTNTFEPIPAFDTEMRRGYSMSGTSMAPILVTGHGNFYRYAQAMNYTCCNDNATDFEALRNSANYSMFMSRLLDDNTNFSPDDVLFYEPSHLRFINYVVNAGSFNSPMQDRVRGTFPDPMIPGLVYDMDIRYEECIGDEPMDNGWSIQMSSRFDLFHLPVNVYKANDLNSGVTGVYHLEAALLP